MRLRPILNLGGVLLLCVASNTVDAQTNIAPKDIVPQDTKYSALATKLQAKEIGRAHV